MAAPPKEDENDGDDEGWKFSVDDVGPQNEQDVPASANGETDSNVAGTLQRDQPLEPGDIDLENAVFVVLGVLVVVVLIAGAILGI